MGSSTEFSMVIREVADMLQDGKSLAAFDLFNKLVTRLNLNRQSTEMTLQNVLFQDSSFKCDRWMADFRAAASYRRAQVARQSVAAR